MRTFKSQPHSILALLTIVSILAVSFASFTKTEAAPNQQINYQGKLMNASNVAVANGTYNMRFWLLTSPSVATTSAVWTESLTGTNRVTVTNGLFSVMLGSTTPFTGVDFNQTLYLGVEIGGTSTPAWDGEMSPRKVLGTVPAAFEADRLDGLTSTQFVRTDATSTIASSTTSTLLTITQSGTGDILNLFDGATEVFTVTDGGRVGIGSSSPIAALSVVGDFALTGGIYDNNNTRGTNGYILRTTGTGVEWMSTSSLNIDLSDTVGILGGTRGGTGLSSIAQNQILIGAAGDTWTQVSTSSLGLSASFTNSSELANLLSDETGTGFSVFSTNPLFTSFRSNASSTIGGGTGATGLTIFGGATTTGNAYFGGNVGIGTDPSATGTERFEVVGNIISKGTEWTLRTSTTTNAWLSVTYGRGLFVAVTGSGSGNRVMTSPDGITWTSRTSAADNSWNSVTFGNGLFVAVSGDGTGNRVMTSPDGITWTSRTSAADNSWNSVTYGNGLFVAVASSGSGNRVMTSPDGITWTSRTSAADTSWYSVTYGNNLFVATGCASVVPTCVGAAGVMTSPDGITWTSRTAPSNNNWYSVTYGNGVFVGVSTKITLDAGVAMTSVDGITWTVQSGAIGGNWRSITYGNGLFVAVGVLGEVMTSPDGVTWKSRTASFVKTWQEVIYGNGTFVAVGSDGSGADVMTSGKADYSVLATNNIYQGGMSVLGGAFNIGTTTATTSVFASNILNIASTTGTSLLTLTSSGRLGLSTSTPSRIFTVGGGDAYFQNNITAASSTITFASSTALTVSGTSYFNFASSSYASTTGLTASNVTFSRSTTTGNAYFGTNVFVAGNVGIGTVSPGAILDILTSADATMRIRSTSSGAYVGQNMYDAAGTLAASFQYGNSSAGTMANAFFLGPRISNQPLVFVRDSGATESARFDGSGRLGIGTTTPAQALSVAGSMHLTGALYDRTYNGGTNGMVLQTTGTGVTWVATSSLGFISGSTFTNSSELAALLSDETGTGSAVFSASPVFTGGVTMSGLNVTGTSTLGFASSTALTVSGTSYFNFASSSYASTTGLTATNAYVLNMLGIGTSTPNATFAIRGTTGMNPFLIASSTGTSLLTLTQAGNLGIGTNNPTARLSVIDSGVYYPSSAPDALYVLGGEGATGGAINVTAGAGTTGGAVNVTAGFGYANAGAINIVGGSGDSGVNGGAVNITGGTAGFGATNGGDIVLTAGVGGFLGSSGKILLSGSGVGIGTSTPSRFFSVGGNALIQNNITAASSTITFASSTALTVSGNTVLGSATSSNLFATVLSATTASISYASTTGLTATNAYLGYASSTGLSATNLTLTGNSVLGYASSTALTVSGNSYFNFASATVASTTGFTATNAYVLNMLGIGTTTPSNQLTVVGTSTFSNLLPMGPYASNISPFSLGASTARWANVWTEFLNVGTSTWSIAGRGSSVDRFAIFDGPSGTGNERFTITPNGNVGVGTTTATARFAVEGESAATFFTAASTTATSTFAGNVNIGSGNLFYNASTTVTSVSSLELGNLAFDSDAGMISWINLPVTTVSATGTVQSYSAQIGDTSILTIYGEANGQTSITNPRVGIGTSTPTSILSIQGTSTNKLLSIVSSTSTSFFEVLASGNVGIGTTTPAQKLSVAGSMHLTGALYDRTYNPGTNGMVLQTTGSGVQWVATSTLGISGGTADGSSNWLFNGSRLSPSTTVGVGIFASSTIGDGTGAGGLTIAGNSTTTLNAYIGGSLGIGTTTQNTTLAIRGTTGSNLINISSSTGATLFTILENGNVGVGTSTPSAKFSFEGNTVNALLPYTFVVDGGGTNNGGGSTPEGGGVLIKGGNVSGFVTNAGGVVVITGGSGSSANSGPGGNVTITSGDAGTGGAAGILTLNSGSGSLQRVLIASTGGNVGIGGTTTPSATLSISGTTTRNLFAFASSTGSNLLTLDARGALNFGNSVDANIFMNGGATNTQMVNSYSIAIGNQALNYASTTSSALRNIALGYQALFGSSTDRMTGTGNFAAGFQAGYSNTSGSSNYFAGSQAGYFNTTGSSNVLIGSSSGYLNSTGSRNNALGVSSFAGDAFGAQSNMGSDNNAFGYSAIGGIAFSTTNSGSFNNAFGSYSLIRNSSGFNNNAFGAYALGFNSSGSNNIGLGAFAGYNHTTGLSTSYLGAFTNTLNGGISSSTALGAGALLTRSNTMVLGGTGASSVDIVTGTSTPFAKLSIQNNYGSTTALFDIATTTSSSYATSSLFRVNHDGRVGVGTTSPGAIFAVLGRNAGSISQSAPLAMLVQGGTSANNGGGINLYAGTGDSGGTINIGSGAGSQAGASGGHLNLFAGNASSFAAGGSVNIDAGAGGDFGGNVVIDAGAAPTNGRILLGSTTGNVGIGTSTPSQKLSVAGSMHLTGAIFDRTYNPGTNGMVLQTTGTGVTWVATSTLGISGGVADGQSNWLFNGSRLSPSTTVGIGIFASSTIGDGTGAGGLTIFGGATTTGNAYFGGDVKIGTRTSSSSLTVRGTTGSNLVSIASSTGATLFNILENGNVGIGTSTPNASLAVKGVDYLLSGSPGKVLDVVGGYAGSPVYGGGGISLLAGGGDYYGGEVVIKGGNVASGGYNGGTTTISGGSGSSGTSGGHLILSGGASIGLSSAGGNVVIDAGTGFSSNGKILLGSTTGNVGIGTSTPAQKLSVAGSMHLTGALYDRSYNPGTNGMVLQTTGSGVQWVATSSLGFSGGVADGQSNWLFNGSRLSPSTTVGIGIFASSTIGGGTGATGLTIAGNSTTTLNAYIGGRLGIGTTTPTLGVFSVSGNNFSGPSVARIYGQMIGSSQNVTILDVSGTYEFSTPGYNLYGVKSSPTSTADAFSNATNNYAFYGNPSGGETDWGIYTTGEDKNYFGGSVGIGTTSPSAKLSVHNTSGGLSPLFSVASSTNGVATSTAFYIDAYGKVGIGSTTPEGTLTINKTGLMGAQVAGIKEYLNFVNNTQSAIYYGDNAYIVNAPTATSTLVGKIIRIEDNSQLGNTVRGLEVQAHRGTTTRGENTGISAFGRTFGLRGTTEGDAGDTFVPAGVFAESRGTTQGNAFRAYSGSITTSSLVNLFHDTSAFTGTGLLMNFGNTTGSFASTSSKFIDLQNAGISKFTISAHGTTTIGDGTMNNMAGLQIGFGGLCVDSDGSCTASTTGRITSVSSAAGNSDLAEMYFSSEDLIPGDIVMIQGGLSVGRADQGNKDRIVGVVSTKPGLLLGFDDVSLNANEAAYPVALKGRVPVRLSTENGPIEKGDRIALSSISGIGMKATESDVVVGIALEDYDGESAYTDGYLNQFGDDLVKAKMQPRNQNTDTRTQDGCSFGAGNEQGAVPCLKDTVVKISTQVTSVDTRTEALRELKAEDAVTEETPDGEEVLIGQALMFVDLDYYQIAPEKNMLAFLLATSSVENGNGEETLWDRLVTLAQNFVDGVLRVAGIRTDELCVGNVCVDEATFLKMVESVANQNVGNAGGSSDETEPVDTAVDVIDDTVVEDEGGSNDGGGEEVVDEVAPSEEIIEEEVVETPIDTVVEEAPAPEVVSEGPVATE